VVSDTATASVHSASQAASRDSISARDSASGATSDVTAVVSGDVAAHPMLADQPEVVRRLVGAMMAKWNGRRASDVNSPTDGEKSVQLDVVEVVGDLASSITPQVRLVWLM